MSERVNPYVSLSRRSESFSDILSRLPVPTCNACGEKHWAVDGCLSPGRPVLHLRATRVDGVKDVKGYRLPWGKKR